jgi:murein tripeptide amidase MpaA
MKNMNLAIAAVVVILAGVGIYLFTKKSPEMTYVAPSPTSTPIAKENLPSPTVVPITPAKTVDTTKTMLGTSVGGHELLAYHFGSGTKEVLFVGGLHGGYEWGTVLLSYALMDHLKANPSAIPANVKVTVIPVANPDGLAKVAGTADRFTAADVSSSKEVQVSGRFNGNTVDLNRNFDCDWKATGMWQSTRVSGGSGAFSEPESKAIKAYVENHSLAGVVAFFSAGGGVYASYCGEGVSSATKSLMNTYAKAAGYSAFEKYNHYEITGDMTNWLAKNNVPAISVILPTHENIDWEKNKAGIMATINAIGR